MHAVREQDDVEVALAVALAIGVPMTAAAQAPPAAGQGAQGEESNWLLRERSFGKFSRQISLPEALDDAAAEARYADGVLYLTLPKKRASQVKRLTIH